MLAVLAAALATSVSSSARAADGSGADPLDSLVPRRRPVICVDQTYALCAGARCFVFNDVAYCSCHVRKGRSISAPFDYGSGDICSLNAEGVDHGYMASTFSLPPSIVAPHGDRALYVCPITSRADYAKCDGGICFTSTAGSSFPGARPPVGDHPIVCSCPVEKASPAHGLEIIGPYPCRKSFFLNCDPAVAKKSNGATLYDGTAIGSTIIGTLLLDGGIPPLNVCQ